MNVASHIIRQVAVRRAGALLLGLALLAPGTSRALPAGAGRVDVGPGLRRVGSSLGPAITGRFVWHPAATWSFGLEVGGVRADDPVYDVLWVGDLALTAALHPVSLGPVLPYVSGAVGYHVVAVEGAGHYGEGGTTGASVGVGALVVLGDRLGLFVEDRYRFGWIDVGLGGDEAQARNLGGNTIWAGLSVLLDPEPPLGYGR